MSFDAGERRPSKAGEVATLKQTMPVSGPLLDRIDLNPEVSAVKFQEIARARAGKSSKGVVRKGVPFPVSARLWLPGAPAAAATTLPNIGRERLPSQPTTVPLARKARLWDSPQARWFDCLGWRLGCPFSRLLSLRLFCCGPFHFCRRALRAGLGGSAGAAHAHGAVSFACSLRSASIGLENPEESLRV
jgi:hypothetical protein